MLKKYSDTDMVWDTETLRWIKPFKNIQSAHIKIEKEPEQKVTKEPGDMSWRELLFDIYKKCRDGVGWENLKKLHDAEDQSYFEMLDKLSGRNKNE